jgi:hypothetical protein
MSSAPFIPDDEPMETLPRASRLLDFDPAVRKSA